jgi:hypothetical protein
VAVVVAMIMKKQIDGAVFRKVIMTKWVKKFLAFSVRWILPPEVYHACECTAKGAETLEWHHVRLEVLTAKTMKIPVLWYVTPCSLAEIQQRFGEIYCPPFLRIKDYCLMLAYKRKCYTLPMCSRFLFYENMVPNKHYCLAVDAL